LTDKQRERIQQSEIVGRLAMTGFSIILYVVLTYFLLNSFDASPTGAIQFSVAVFVALLAMMGFPEVRHVLRLREALREGTVEHISGTATLSTAIAPARRYSRRYFVTCTPKTGNPARFPVKRDVFHAFDVGTRYRIYYLPRALEIVSAVEI
jgi:hypothetical protein